MDEHLDTCIQIQGIHVSGYKSILVDGRLKQDKMQYLIRVLQAKKEEQQK